MKGIDEEVRLGIFRDAAEAINSALRKAYAKKKQGISDMADEEGAHLRRINAQGA